MTDDSSLEPEFGDVEALLRDLETDELTLESPPAEVWAGIEAALADDPADPADPVEPGLLDAAPGTVVPFRSRRRWAIPTLAAAALILVVVGAVALVRNNSSEPTTLATAELAFDPAAFDPAGADAAAQAVLLDDDGDDVLEIDDDSLPFDLGEDASLELWMIKVEDGEIIDMVSLGEIPADGTRDFAVPPGYDPAIYSVVDISIEPHDGDATHSGRSILRGALTPV